MNDSQKEQLQQEVVRRYENLSDELKKAMMSVSSAEIIYEVGKKHDLNVEKIGVLAEEVGYIMLGMIPPSDFVSDLKNLLEIEENKANEIAQEINHKIFLPIREEMKKTYGTNFLEETITERQGTSDMRQGTPKTIVPPRPIPPTPSRVVGPSIPQRPQPPYQFGQGPAPFQTRPTTESGLGRPTPPPTPPGPATPTTFERPTPPPIPPLPAGQPVTEGDLSPRPMPPPIFSQPKEITQTEEIKQPQETRNMRQETNITPPGLPTKQPTTDNLQPPTLTKQPSGFEVESEKLDVGLPEVEEELKPKLLESLPKEKPLEARIAEKTPPKYHADPYRESVE